MQNASVNIYRLNMWSIIFALIYKVIWDRMLDPKSLTITFTLWCPYVVIFLSYFSKALFFCCSFLSSGLLLNFSKSILTDFSATGLSLTPPSPFPSFTFLLQPEWSCKIQIWLYHPSTSILQWLLITLKPKSEFLAKLTKPPSCSAVLPAQCVARLPCPHPTLLFSFEKLLTECLHGWALETVSPPHPTHLYLPSGNPFFPQEFLPALSVSYGVIAPVPLYHNTETTFNYSYPISWVFSHY